MHPVNDEDGIYKVYISVRDAYIASNVAFVLIEMIIWVTNTILIIIYE